MKTQLEKESLQNAANDLKLIVHEKIQDDKRKTVARFFVTLNGASVSPVLDYTQMNHFLLGWRKAKKETESFNLLTKLQQS